MESRTLVDQFCSSLPELLFDIATPDKTRGMITIEGKEWTYRLLVVQETVHTQEVL